MRKQTINYLTSTLIPILIVWIPTIIWFNYVYNKPLEKQQIPPSTIHEVVIDYISWDMALEHIKHNETLQLEAYELDGHCYIGYGKQCSKNQQPITEAEADRLLETTLKHYVEYVSETYNVYGEKALALALLWYNVSPNSILNSDLHYCIKNNIEDPERIINSWLSLCNFQGKPHKKLQERRQFEINMYFNN